MQFRLSTLYNNDYSQYPLWRYRYRSMSLNTTPISSAINEYFNPSYAGIQIYKSIDDENNFVTELWMPGTTLQEYKANMLQGTIVPNTGGQSQYQYDLEEGNYYVIRNLRTSSSTSTSYQNYICFKCVADFTITRSRSGSQSYVTLPANSVCLFNAEEITSWSEYGNEEITAGTYMPEDTTDAHWGWYRIVSKSGGDVIFSNSNIIGTINYNRSIELSNKIIGSVCPAELTFSSYYSYSTNSPLAFEVKYEDTDVWKKMGWFWLYDKKRNSQHNYTYTFRDGLGFVDENGYEFFKGCYSENATTSSSSLPIYRYQAQENQSDISSITLTRGQAIPMVNHPSASIQSMVDGTCFMQNQVTVANGVIVPSAKAKFDIFDYAKVLRYSAPSNGNRVTINFESNVMNYSILTSGEFNLAAAGNGQFLSTDWTQMRTYTEGITTWDTSKNKFYIKFWNSTNVSSDTAFWVFDSNGTTDIHLVQNQDGSWTLSNTGSTLILGIAPNVEEVQLNVYTVPNSDLRTYIQTNDGYYYDILQRQCSLLWTYSSTYNEPYGVFYNGKLYNTNLRTVNGDTMTIYVDKVYSLDSPTTSTLNKNSSDFNTWINQWSSLQDRYVFTYLSNPIALKSVTTVYDLLSNMSSLDYRKNAKSNATYQLRSQYQAPVPPAYVLTNIENKWTEEGMTYRDVLEDIAMLCNSIIYVDEYNWLVWKQIQIKGLIFTDDIAKKVSWKTELFNVPTGIQVNTDTTQNLIHEGTDKYLAVFDNNFCDVQDLSQLILTYIYPILVQYNDLSEGISQFYSDKLNQVEIITNNDYNIDIGDVVYAQSESNKAVILSKTITGENVVLSSYLY